MNFKKFTNCIAVLGIFVLLSSSILTLTPYPANYSAEQTDAEYISPHAAYTEWQYKTENGKIYKRLYNVNTGAWIGDWIYVCDV